MIHKEHKTSMLRWISCDYSDAYIPVKGTITDKITAAQVEPNNATNEKVIFKTCASCTNRISRIINT